MAKIVLYFSCVFIFFTVVGQVLSPLRSFADADSEEIKTIKAHSIDDINSDLNFSKPIVDIAIHHVRGCLVSWPDLQNQLWVAKDTFRKAGVELNVISARTIEVPHKWKWLTGTTSLADPNSFQEDLDFYDNIRQKQYTLSGEASEVFSAIIEKNDVNEKTIHIISLCDVKMSYYEKNYEGRWINHLDSTGALSFPPYILEDRIPKHLRGVITIQSTSHEWTLAHELGHKLINVSHEGLDSCPKFSGNKIPGLMGYEGDIDIFSGIRGRWHLERLQLSPFLYKLNKNKNKNWNGDFKSSGSYDDAIYGKYYLRPSCP